MFVISLLFCTVLLLLIFALTKDTGQNTKYARKSMQKGKQQFRQEGTRSVNTAKVLKVG